VTTREAGRVAEARAEKFLRDQGFKLVARNFLAKTGEIDLIMSKSDMLVFVEVRMRNNGRYGTGAETVTKRKQLKIINTAHIFLQKSAHWHSYRFDVVSINDSIDKSISNAIDWIEGAFTLD